MRFDQMVKGSTQIITDILKQRKSVLLIGVPGVGKTTSLRELACVLSLDGVKVEIIDTSNEIAGEGDELQKEMRVA
jgi:stage III sporulation protein SpoIIIAA